MTVRDIHRIFMDMEKTGAETLDIHWIYTGVYTGRTLECILNCILDVHWCILDWSVYWTVHYTLDCTLGCTLNLTMYTECTLLYTGLYIIYIYKYKILQVCS